MRIRKQTYSLDQYLMLMKDETIRSDQDCQRLSGQWNCNMVNELIFTVLTDDYIPPIILGEEISNGITREYIIDGLQRSSSLFLFRYGNTKITKSLDEYMVKYQRKIFGEDGNPKRDERGEILWETAQCDVRNKTYEQLPEELKIRFNGYQMEVAIHQNCDQIEISKYVRKYNNHVSMNQAQKAFTYADTFAREIRNITENRFFLDVYNCSRNDRKNGTIERVIGETVLLCNYPDLYRKDTKKNFEALNENASLSDFDNLNNLLVRLTASLETTTEIRGLFNSKHAHIFIAAFKAFTETGHGDKDYGKFLEWFVNGGEKVMVDGKSWKSWNENKATRDSSTVHGKIEYIVALFVKYFKETRQVA